MAQTEPQTFLSFYVLDDFLRFSKKLGFLGIFGQPYCGIGATIRIGREMLCLPYAGFFTRYFTLFVIQSLNLFSLVTRTFC